MAKDVDIRRTNLLTEKWQTLLRVRDQAIRLVTADGRAAKIRNGPPVMEWNGFGFSILYRVPSGQFRELERLARASGMPIMAPFGLDIWVGSELATRLAAPLPIGSDDSPNARRIGSYKAVNVEWRDENRLDVATFRRGPWEVPFLMLK